MLQMLYCISRESYPLYLYTQRRTIHLKHNTKICIYLHTLHIHPNVQFSDRQTPRQRYIYRDTERGT